jgi:hypothetical protein
VYNSSAQLNTSRPLLPAALVSSSGELPVWIRNSPDTNQSGDEPVRRRTSPETNQSGDEPIRKLASLEKTDQKSYLSGVLQMPWSVSSEKN